MNKVLLFFAAFILSAGIAFSQSHNQKSSEYHIKKTEKTDIWFVAFKTSETPFPTEAFTLANADYFITTVQGWISNNQALFASIINNRVAGNFIILKRSDYYKMPAEKQDLLKEWVKNIERYFQMQDNYQIDDVKRYLLSSSDFSTLQSLIK